MARRGKPARNRPGLGHLPGTEGKLEVAQDLISDPSIERAHQSQHLRDPFHPARMAGPLSIFPGLQGGTTEFCLGQGPQVGFRALAVHILSVLPGRGPARRAAS